MGDMKGIAPFPILSLASLSSGGDSLKHEATFCPLKYIQEATNCVGSGYLLLFLDHWE